MTTRLTEPAIKKALREAAESGKRRDLTDAGQEGLRVRVTPAGSASWVLACRDRSGRMRRFPVGQYPAMGVAEAREHARVIHHKVRQEGADPIAERRRERERAEAARQGVGTLTALMDVYEKQKGATLRSWPEYQRSISRVFGKFLNRALADVTLADLQLAADGYAAKQQASLAARCLRPVLKWASAPGRGYVPAALAALTAPATPGRRDRVLSRNELAALLPVLRQSSRPYAAAMEFMLLTLLRRDEVCDMCWRDIDLDAATLMIVPEKTKNRQPHVVPLSCQAVALLRTMHPRSGLAAQNQPEALVFATSTGSGLVNWDRETKRIMLQAGLATKNPKTGAVTMIDKSPRWHRHDLRRTGATMLGEMGELPDIIEAALNHTSIHSPLAATYNRSRYRPQVAAALQRLADALDGIVAGAGEIVPLHPAEAATP